MFAFEPLDLLWVQFNVLNPQTKRAGKQVVRFGPNTAVVMVLIKVPANDGTFVWYLLARRKYQFAAKDLFIEFSRGWVGDGSDTPGMYLFKRDYPGLFGNQGVKSITEHEIGSPMWENNAQFSNMVSHHLVVVEMNGGMTHEALQKLLVEARLRQEYPVEKLEDLDGKDLVSYPMVWEISGAATLLNAILSARKGLILALFGESFSVRCWSMFLALWGKQFPELLPEPAVLI
jgi:hypothetical protein